MPEYYNTELFLPECHGGRGADLLVGSTVARNEEDIIIIILSCFYLSVSTIYTCTNTDTIMN